MIYFFDENTNIRIKTDTYEELIPKYKFNAQVAGSDLKIYGQKISPNVFAFSDIIYPAEADIATLVSELNTWKNYYDWHNLSFTGPAGGDLSGNYPDPLIKTNYKNGVFGITIDGQGGVISTGLKGKITIPYSGTITGWE